MRLRWLVPLPLVLIVGLAFAVPDDRPVPGDVELVLPRQVPVYVTGKVTPAVVPAGAPIPLTITIRNELPEPIYHQTYRLKPVTWNGETVCLSLVDIYRDGREFNLYLSRPELGAGALRISGTGRFEIPPGKSLSIETDASKWKLRDGWLPGRYRVTVRAEHLTADRWCRLTVLSEPFEFEIE